MYILYLQTLQLVPGLLSHEVDVNLFITAALLWKHGQSKFE